MVDGVPRPHVRHHVVVALKPAHARVLRLPMVVLLAVAQLPSLATRKHAHCHCHVPLVRIHLRAHTLLELRHAHHVQQEPTLAAQVIHHVRHAQAIHHAMLDLLTFRHACATLVTPSHLVVNVCNLQCALHSLQKHHA